MRCVTLDKCHDFMIVFHQDCSQVSGLCGLSAGLATQVKQDKTRDRFYCPSEVIALALLAHNLVTPSPGGGMPSEIMANWNSEADQECQGPRDWFQRKSYEAQARASGDETCSCIPLRRVLQSH